MKDIEVKESGKLARKTVGASTAAKVQVAVRPRLSTHPNFNVSVEPSFYFRNSRIVIRGSTFKNKNY